MLEIAICDNDEADLELLDQYVTGYFKKNRDRNGNIETFLSSEKLKSRLEEKRFDIFVLDIMMPQINGIELGRLIRESDDQAEIIYTTFSKEFAFDAYGIHALRYLEKPIVPEKLEEAMNVGILSVERNKIQKVSVNAKNGLIAVKVSDIIYIENISRCAVYVLKDGTEIVGTYNRKTFEDSIYPLNEHPDFLQPHKSFFVNMKYIQAIQGGTLSLDNGRQVFISRNRSAETKKRYLKYLSQRGAGV
ncbi:LytTR family DNA-binding domain-containing protein [Faecalicatena sp. AGMB00832]|uniref:Stage 0 sporulation protein A homolog n=1 Tax=Faecalicatena faecalis TaxID=2726362 RepID=A0ABS6D3G9_9FIRM|nr:MULTISPECIES: LytTR family DNA-binding domain-containing protein [Faecalicatena]MBU3876140.1 LytTR family DNA-binding domain-containing protein [Faecalicatena faecalis]MCI6465074.1 LytTR family DNA-binding domain-containing protein [Faecalicatena sp.]MDY5617095.1 LytTR family DNA-binding domain-containing protein [Lachnospiraceae bacterium]